MDLLNLLATASAGIARRQGVRVAIVGRPNVGKSSLLNALLREDRAIVTAVPGTTRDTVEESASIDGVAVVLVDTAGLAAASRDEMVRLGMERTRRAMQRADVALLVLDAAQPVGEDDVVAAGLAAQAPQSVTVWNKCDLASPGEPSPLGGSEQARVSALTGAGLADLEGVLLRTALGVCPGDGGSGITSQRQRQAVARAVDALERALAAPAQGLPGDLVALDIREAADALGEITGETAGDDLLRTIFASFCVGK